MPPPRRYVEFFTANIRNPHTRRAYARACGRFFAWCEGRNLTLTASRPHDKLYDRTKERLTICDVSRKQGPAKTPTGIPRRAGTLGGYGALLGRRRRADWAGLLHAPATDV
jgi:hypothetical protein